MICTVANIRNKENYQKLLSITKLIFHSVITVTNRKRV